MWSGPDGGHAMKTHSDHALAGLDHAARPADQGQMGGGGDSRFYQQHRQMGKTVCVLERHDRLLGLRQILRLDAPAFLL
jgi:hypothetical protein